MSAEYREELERLARSGVEAHRRVMTAKALLALADEASIRATAKALGSHEEQSAAAGATGSRNRRWLVWC